MVRTVSLYTISAALIIEHLLRRLCNYSLRCYFVFLSNYNSYDYVKWNLIMLANLVLLPNTHLLSLLFNRQSNSVLKLWLYEHIIVFSVRERINLRSCYEIEPWKTWGTDVISYSQSVHLTTLIARSSRPPTVRSIPHPESEWLNYIVDVRCGVGNCQAGHRSECYMLHKLWMMKAQANGECFPYMYLAYSSLSPVL